MEKIIWVLLAVVLFFAAMLFVVKPFEKATATPTPTAWPAKPPAGTILSSPSNLTVHFIYVDLGEAVFVDSPGKDLLIDAGCRKCNQTVMDYLNSIGEWPEILAASNHDEDHMGGLIAFLEQNRSYQVWDSNSTKDTLVFAEYIALARQQNFSVLSRGQTLWLDEHNNTKITVLNPVQPLEFSGENDNSLVLKLEFGNSSFLFPGDCERQCEQSVLDYSRASGVDPGAFWLKAAHHCSNTSTSQKFLDVVRPAIAVCGVGAQGNSRYGHPHKPVLERLAAMGTRTYATLYNGTIQATTDGEDYWVNKLLPGPPN